MFDRQLKHTISDHMARGNEHMARGNEHMARGNEHMARGNEHMARGNQLMTRGNELMARGSEHMARGNELMTRGNELMRQNSEVVSRAIEAMDEVRREVELSRRDRADMVVFIREITTRSERHSDATVRAIDANTATLIDMRADMAASRKAILSVIDKLEPPPEG